MVWYPAIDKLTIGYAMALYLCRQHRWAPSTTRREELIGEILHCVACREVDLARPQYK